jgi:hypothetical protein
MFNTSFKNDTIRKYTALIGTLFNNITIEKSDGAANGVVQTIKVPINYSSKDKLFERLRADPNLDRPFAMQLPRMGFELVTLEYDRSRKLTSTIKIREEQNANTVTSVYMPVPYNLQYRLSILVKSQTDGTRIVEQILPFFTPDWTPTVELVPEMGLKYDIPIVLEGISVEDSYEGDFNQGRTITWTLDFTVKGWLFGPVKTVGGGAGGIIKFAKINFYTDLTANTPAEYMTVQPGLTSNGEPTTNIAETIPYANISSEDDYGYIVRIVTE